MSTLNAPNARWAVAGMAVLMAATRFHHAGTALSLPDASLAVFFLAGCYLGNVWVFAWLLAEAFLIDYLAVAHLGVSDYCISPAYVFLIPTYGVMWLGGRWSARSQRLGLASALHIGAVLLGSASLAFVISNGSFYLFSGRFADVNWVQYRSWVAGLYFPYVAVAVLYSSLAIGLHGVFRSLSTQRLWRANFR